ncbi:MAG: hypothetical protein OXP28_14540 [Gammaproteobacteria bacterium]|nr:hypothetical protein [Gammaproteobacteria bacterium]
MIDAKDVWAEWKITFPLAVVVSAGISVLAGSTWLSSLELAGYVLLFVAIWGALKVLWQKHRRAK